MACSETAFLVFKQQDGKDMKTFAPGDCSQGLTSGGLGAFSEAVVPEKPVPSERQVQSLRKCVRAPHPQNCGMGQRVTNCHGVLG